MASPAHFNTRMAPPPTAASGPAAGQFAGVSADAGVPHADRIPPYVGGIILLSVVTLFALRKAQFRMIVGAG